MLQKNSLVLWGERGLVTGLLIDLYRGSRSDRWRHFFEKCSYVLPPVKTDVRSVSVVVEPDFSNEGFGHPDGIMKFELEDGATAVVILEAKRLPYGKVCAAPSNRGGIGYNSTLNGQLELNHCLALALAEHQVGGLELREPDWILHSPYNSDRRSKSRSLKNQVVIEQIVRPFSGFSFRSYFHLVITTDRTDPFENFDNAGLWPELYHPEYPFRNCWKELRPQFGWASWDSVERLMGALSASENGTESSVFSPTLDANRQNFRMGLGASVIEAGTDEVGAALETEVIGRNIAPRPSQVAFNNRGSRGATMIFAPSINPSTFLHFSWLNESCALRDYSNSPNIMPFEDRTKQTSEVISKIVKEVAIRNRRPISDTHYWNETAHNLNKTELPASVTDVAVHTRRETSDEVA
jgi:hypothetical protein